MAKKSAGILLYRYNADRRLEVFLVHPGGPFWKNKEEGAWSIPKGEFGEEPPLEAARREFWEETGVFVEGPLEDLGSVKQAGGKTVYAYAAERDIDPENIQSNTFEMEWPPKSGKKQAFPEIDRAGWFDLEAAAVKILRGQRPLLGRLAESRK